MTSVMYHSVISGPCLRSRSYVSNRDVFIEEISTDVFSRMGMDRRMGVSLGDGGVVRCWQDRSVESLKKILSLHIYFG